jgi:hypothetical protein
VTLLLILLAVGGWLARRNLLAGRGDRKGALRLAAALFVLHMAGFAVGADHVRSVSEIALIGVAAAIGLLKATLLWTGYIALEPTLRRRWPQALISWTRLLDGRWTDPLVGRDLLFGICAAVLTAVPVLFFLNSQRSGAPSGDALPGAMVLGGMKSLLASFLNNIGTAVLSCLATFLALFIVRLITRRDSIAVLVSGLLFGLPAATGALDWRVGLLFGFSVNLLAFFVAARFGLMSLFGFLAANTLLYGVAGTYDLSVWYATNGLLLYAVLAACSGFAFRSALAGRPLFGDPAGGPPAVATVSR